MQTALFLYTSPTSALAPRNRFSLLEPFPVVMFLASESAGAKAREDLLLLRNTVFVTVKIWIFVYLHT